MAKQTVNLGTSANKGDGDPLRTAFDKINDNFNELYAGNFADPASISSSIIPSVTNTYDLGSSTKRWSDLHVNDFIYLNGSRLEVTAGGALLIGGSPPSEVQDTIGSVFGDDSTLLVDGVNNVIPKANIEDSANWDTAFAWGNHASAGYQVAGAPHDGDIEGSVFGDDSTLLVDAVNNKIVGAVDTPSLRTSEAKIALGDSAGATNQGNDAVAISSLAGYVDQGSQAVAVGVSAGRERQGAQATALGRYAGQNDQGVSAVAIGHSAGRETQGTVAIAIGKLAGETNQAANSIVLNATGSAVENTTASSLRIKPIRSATMTTILGYDATSGEVMHNAAIPGYISLADLKTEVAASADFAAFKVRIAAL